MTEAEIITIIRREIKEIRATSVNDTMITATILRGVTLLGLAIKKVAPSFFNKRISLSSNTHIFSWPSDCASILNVWDMEDNAGDITGATNATPIVITETAHERSSDEITVVHSVAGNTAANGTWKITYVDADSYSLNSSVGTAAYTSGGKAYKEPSDTVKIHRAPLAFTTQENDRLWYPRERNIVIDDPDFTYDLIVDYVGMPDAVTDIPAEYHEGLVAFGVIKLIHIPPSDSKNFNGLSSSLRINSEIWLSILSQIEGGLLPSNEPFNLPDTDN